MFYYQAHIVLFDPDFRFNLVLPVFYRREQICRRGDALPDLLKYLWADPFLIGFYTSIILRIVPVRSYNVIECFNR